MATHRGETAADVWGPLRPFSRSVPQALGRGLLLTAALSPSVPAQTGSSYRIEGLPARSALQTVSTFQNTGLATQQRPLFAGTTCIVAVHEASQGGTDLDGDGSTNGVVAHAFWSDGEVRNLGIEGADLLTSEGHVVVLGTPSHAIDLGSL